MDKVGTPATMPFYTDDDWGTSDLPAVWGQGVPHSDTIDFFFAHNKQPWGADDDTDIEYMYQYLYEVHQTSLLTAKQIQQGWLTHIYSEEDAPLYKKFPSDKAVKENFLWESNQRARILMAKGMLPPHTSEPKNNNKYMSAGVDPLGKTARACSAIIITCSFSECDACCWLASECITI